MTVLAVIVVSRPLPVVMLAPLRLLASCSVLCTFCCCAFEALPTLTPSRRLNERPPLLLDALLLWLLFCAALTMLRMLRPADVRLVARSKGVSGVVARLAKEMLAPKS